MVTITRLVTKVAAITHQASVVHIGKELVEKVIEHMEIQKVRALLMLVAWQIKLAQ